MQAIQSDPDIRQEAFNLDEKLTQQQVGFVAEKLRDLISRLERCPRSERMNPTVWPEWQGFIDATYSCGFVCSNAGEHLDDDDGTPIMNFIALLEREPGRIDRLNLRELRQIIHYIIRSERWGDAGASTGGGAVWNLITSPLGDAIARRLGA